MLDDDEKKEKQASNSRYIEERCVAKKCFSACVYKQSIFAIRPRNVCSIYTHRHAMSSTWNASKTITTWWRQPTTTTSKISREESVKEKKYYAKQQQQQQLWIKKIIIVIINIFLRAAYLPDGCCCYIFFPSFVVFFSFFGYIIDFAFFSTIFVLCVMRATKYIYICLLHIYIKRSERLGELTVCLLHNAVLFFSFRPCTVHPSIVLSLPNNESCNRCLIPEHICMVLYVMKSAILLSWFIITFLSIIVCRVSILYEKWIYNG